MWHIKLNGLNEKIFSTLKNILNDRIYKKEIEKFKIIEYYLILEEQEITSAPEALSIGEHEIKLLSSILSLLNIKNHISVDIPYEVHQDGTRTGYLSFTDTISITDELKIYSNNSLIYSTEEETNKLLQDIYEKALSSEIKKRLIIYLGKEINWVNAYKIYEVLKHHYIKESELKKIPELATFAHTANSPDVIGDDARHGVQTHDNPKKIANLENAYKKLKELAIKFLIDENT